MYLTLHKMLSWFGEMHSKIGVVAANLNSRHYCWKITITASRLAQMRARPLSSVNVDNFLSTFLLSRLPSYNQTRKVSPTVKKLTKFLCLTSCSVHDYAPRKHFHMLQNKKANFGVFWSKNAISAKSPHAFLPSISPNQESILWRVRYINGVHF